MKAIETENLTKYYGKSRGIIDVSLSIDEGDFFGFIGPNGAGKSTFIRTALGLIAPTSGKIELLGKDITTDRLEVLRQVGYLPAEAKLWGGMKVSELLVMSEKLRGVDCSAERKILCDRLELDTERKIDELSLGNRKKVGIVAALQHKPSLYILDEPTSGLDPLMQKEFFDTLTERQREGATIFLSSHNLSEIARYCNRAAVIREGRVILNDSVKTLAHTGVKRVSLRGVNALPRIDGIRDESISEGEAEFLYSGNVANLLSSIAALNPSDISISDPELDEVLLNYYERGNA